MRCDYRNPVDGSVCSADAIGVHEGIPLCFEHFKEWVSERLELKFEPLCPWKDSILYPPTGQDRFVFHAVNSSNVVAVASTKNSPEVYVAYKSGIYVYFDVPLKVVDAFHRLDPENDSYGRFIATQIKPVSSYARWTDWFSDRTFMNTCLCTDCPGVVIIAGMAEDGRLRVDHLIPPFSTCECSYREAEEMPLGWWRLNGPEDTRELLEELEPVIKYP